MSKEIVERIDSQQLADALSTRYLSYAVSTIVSRALPDVRDGLKPVHRRILYSMLRQKLSPSAAFRKCATVVGDVLGHYHPHGDSSVYDAMVRLAQDFSVRYPRRTEARLLLDDPSDALCLRLVKEGYFLCKWDDDRMFGGKLETAWALEYQLDVRYKGAYIERPDFWIEKENKNE